MPEVPVSPQILRPEAARTPATPEIPKTIESGAADSSLSGLLIKLEAVMATGDDRGVIEALASTNTPAQTTDKSSVVSDKNGAEPTLESGVATSPTETVEPKASSTGIDIEKPLNEQTKEHLARLKPEVITTDDGVERTVFTFQRGGTAVKVLFYPPNELPVSDDYFKGKRLYVIGDKPSWRTDADWNAYVAKLQTLDAGAARRPGEDLLNPTNFYYNATAERERNQKH